ncbi:MAG: Hsp20/alpha crystallin family protein [Candidatus Bathyarchaeia archaeon]|nr:Hsp20/alpha crystallin family protein [Candidatus Bathyarchaeia archaeon]
MTKKEKGKKVEAEKDLEELRKEIAQKGREIEQLKKTVEEMRTQIQGKEKTGEEVELNKIFDDVSELLDVGFSIFGTSGKIQGEKSKGRGLFGLINDLAKLAEKSQTYQKRINLGKKGVVDFRISSRPIKGSYTTKPKGRLKISKPKSKIPPKRTHMPPPTASIEEREPIVDVFEEENHVNVMAELPGVEENDVKLRIEDNLLTISADTSEKKYYKEVKLPTSVEKDSVESKYRNGVLEVKLKKAKETREKDA